MDTNFYTMKSILVTINLGSFEPYDDRPDMLTLQHEVNALFYTKHMNFMYNRIELEHGNKTTVILFYHYESIKDSIEINSEELELKIKTLSKSLNANARFYLQSKEESDKFLTLIDDSETGELSTAQIDALKIYE